jgi:hypothetical protein
MQVRCEDLRRMRLSFVCIALSFGIQSVSSVAAAEISFVRGSAADEEVASRLEALIGQPVVRVSSESGALDRADADAAVVSIDRGDALVRVVSIANPDGLTRTFEPAVMEQSPYAVALAAAELLDWLDVLAEPGAPAPTQEPTERSGRRLSFGLGLDFELQAQVARDLAFLRPAFNAELAFDRDARGFFWAAGVRVSAPLGRDVAPLATELQNLSLRAQAMDAAAQFVVGYELGSLAFTAHAAAGLAYLHVAARDAQQRTLGSEASCSPLVGAGLGVRLSVAYGFAVAVRGEGQWAGPETKYSIAMREALDSAAIRFGFLAGVLWESALGWGQR